MDERMYRSCRLCPRACGVDRLNGERGACGMGAQAVLAHTMLHMWEEPFLSGTRGSGTVFFSGCSLGCVYCQNKAISRGERGRPVSVEKLADAFLSLREQGAHNLNLVTASHFLPSVRAALLLARERGLRLPVVYNTSGYETVEALRALEGLVDVYLTDLRYARADTAARYSGAADYPAVARRAVKEMVSQTGAPVFDGEGMLVRGTVARILLLPSHLIEAKMNVKHLYGTFGDDIYISLMRQYTPMKGAVSPLDRPVSDAEYLSLVSYAASLGVTRAFTQEKGSVSESFIPNFEK